MMHRNASIARSQRSRSSRRDDQSCYGSFLAAAAELHHNDAVYVVVRPCSDVQRSNATQFGIYRIRWTTKRHADRFDKGRARKTTVFWTERYRWAKSSVVLLAELGLHHILNQALRDSCFYGRHINSFYVCMYVCRFRGARQIITQGTFVYCDPIAEMTCAICTNGGTTLGTVENMPPQFICKKYVGTIPAYCGYVKIARKRI